MQGKNETQELLRKRVSRQGFVDCFWSSQVKVVDLTDFLAKFPEIFSITVFEPESTKASDLDPNDAMIAPCSNAQTKKPAPVINQAKPRLVIPKSPFSGSGFTDDLTLRVWYYIDEQDNVQGPFTSLEMDNWFDQGYFFNELLIRFRSNNQFYKLIELFGKIAPTSIPNSTVSIEKQPLKENQVGNVNTEKLSSKEDTKQGLTEVLKQAHITAQEGAGQSGAATQQTGQKTGTKRGSKRTSVEEAPSMMPKNIWENFIDKNKGSDQKSETPLSEDKQISPQKHDDSSTKITSQELNSASDQRSVSAQEDSLSNRSDPRLDLKDKTSDFSGDSGANSPYKLHDKRSNSRTDSDNNSTKKGGDSDRNQKKFNNQQNKKNQREYLEYRPKDDKQDSNKTEKEEQKGDLTRHKKSKEDLNPEVSSKDEEAKQKDAKPEAKQSKKKYNHKSSDFQSEGWFDDGPSKISTVKNQIEQSRTGTKENQQETANANQNGYQSSREAESTTNQGQNGRKQPQGRDGKRQSQSKYVVVFEPKSGSSPEQEKTVLKVEVENEKPTINQPLPEDAQKNRTTEPQHKLNNSELIHHQEDSSDYISLLGSVELTKKDPNFTNDAGKPFLPRPVTESRFTKLFRENSSNK